MNKFHGLDARTLSARLSILKDIQDDLERSRNNLFKDYREIGRDPEKQRTRYNGELLWLDEAHTIPEMEPIYGYVDLTLDDLDDDEKAKAMAYADILANLINLLDM